MQLEWNKWLNGMTNFKQGQGMLWIFGLVLFIVLWCRGDGKRRKLLAFSALMGVLVVCPITAMVLLKGYTPFYDWFDLLQIVPFTVFLALGAVELVSLLAKSEIPGLHFKQPVKTIISLGCAVVLMLAGTTFHAFDRQSEADGSGVPVEVAEVLAPLREEFADEELVLAAPSEILLYTRLYEADWMPLYGRDLWSPKAASYINSGYDIEYDYYELLEKEQLTEEEAEQLTAIITEGPAECVIVPTGWIAEMGPLADCELVNGNDSYTIIIKKDLGTE